MGWREDAVFGKITAERDILLGQNPRLSATSLQRFLARGTFEDFRVAPVCVKKDGAGAATGAAGDENVMMIGENMFEYHIIGTQTIVSPVLVAAGLNIGMDQADNDGVEITQGILARQKHAYVVGTDRAFYFRVKFTIAVVAGTDDCLVGFRKAEPYQAGPDAYDEWAALNVIEGNINIETELNAGGTTTTDTTDDWADTEQHTLEVRVDHAGAVTYLIDDAAPTVTAAFSFDSGEVLVPFMLVIQANAAQTGALTLQEWECGYLSARHP